MAAKTTILGVILMVMVQPGFPRAEIPEDATPYEIYEGIGKTIDMGVHQRQWDLSVR